MAIKEAFDSELKFQWHKNKKSNNENWCFQEQQKKSSALFLNS
jgi:hypothetical protein